MFLDIKLPFRNLILRTLLLDDSIDDTNYEHYDQKGYYNANDNHKHAAIRFSFRFFTNWRVTGN